MSASPSIDHPHAVAAPEILAALRVSVDDGLSNEDILERRKVVGPNTISRQRTVSPLRVLLHQFVGPVVYLLGAAAALAFYFGEIEEGFAIVVVLALNAVIGFITELKAARSIEALRKLGTQTVLVRRDHQDTVVPADALVPGDIVLLSEGDAVAADLRIIEASHLAADESTLTGEPVAADKHTAPVAPGARLGDRTSMLFKGTVITRGSGTAVAVATGIDTELGRVTQLVLEADAGSSPLERKLARLSAQLVWATLVIAVVIAAAGLLRRHEYFLIIESAIALAVAAIPEGLPIVATLALARGMWKMARQNALIEHLSAVETLGATTVILTDKTGTLTENRMTVRRLCTASADVDVADQPGADESTTSLLRIAVLCTDAHLDRVDGDGTGDPMEVALLRAGLEAGLSRATLLEEFPLVRRHAFDRDAKMMATVHSRDDHFLIAVKGAPEAVVAHATRLETVEGDVALDDTMRREWLDRASRLGEHGLRVLACAAKTAGDVDDAPYDSLVLAGFVGLEDPPRADVPAAIRDCRRAGIRVVMVTGDHAVTARSIAGAVGLGENGGAVAEGAEITAIIERGAAAVRAIDVFARVAPAEKLALVKAYQNAGDVVAMTGDGVNDAPALRQADIGVAMGRRGTDVAREAAAMILLDDAFPTIVNAVREGRVIFSNIRRFVAYLLSCNLSEVLVIGIAVLSSLPLPVLPLQILYLNLVTDVFPAFALAMGKGQANLLAHPPRDPKEAILARPQWIVIVLHAIALTGGTFLALAIARWLSLDARATTTVSFLTLAFAQLWHVFNMRGRRAPLLANEITRNRWLWAAIALCTILLAVPPYLPATARVLHLAPLTASMWMIVLGGSLAPLVVTQTVMASSRRVAGRSKPLVSD